MPGWIPLLVGLVLLIVGAEWIVRGAASIASRLGISPLVIGLTIVAFGTSSPEIAVSLNSAFEGRPDIAVGNVIGSNIFNVLFILGLSALIVPLSVHMNLIKIDVPILIATSAAVWILSLDHSLSRIDGILLLTGLLVYTVVIIVLSRRETAQVAEEYAEVAPPSTATRGILPSIAFVAMGLAVCVLGSHWLVEGAVDVAKSLGLSELVISLTIIAAGTSLPEVATSILAAIRGQRDIAVGNVVGSCLFNLLGILGLTGIVSPLPIPVNDAALFFDIPVMTAAALVCLPIFFTGHRINRWEGGLFLGAYVAYLVYLILATTRHDAAGPFGAILLWFALPLAAFGILRSVYSTVMIKLSRKRG